MTTQFTRDQIRAMLPAERKEAILSNAWLFQEACNRFVHRNIIHRATSLMSAISSIMWDCQGYYDAFCEYPEDTMELFQSRNYEPAVESFIDDADLDQLEWIADNCGYWNDVLDEIGFADACRTLAADRERLEEEISVTLDEGMVEELKEKLSEWPEPLELEDWLDDEPEKGERWGALRDKVSLLVTEKSEYEEIANEFNLDPEYDEVYEHWIVDSHLAGELSARGEIVRDFCDFTIWGRCCTGQSISLDDVIRNIVRAQEDYSYVWEL